MKTAVHVALDFRKTRWFQDTSRFKNLNIYTRHQHGAFLAPWYPKVLYNSLSFTHSLTPMGAAVIQGVSHPSNLSVLPKDKMTDQSVAEFEPPTLRLVATHSTYWPQSVMCCCFFIRFFISKRCLCYNIVSNAVLQMVTPETPDTTIHTWTQHWHQHSNIPFKRC